MGAGGVLRLDAERYCRFATRLEALNAVGCGVVTSSSACHSIDVDATTY